MDEIGQTAKLGDRLAYRSNYAQNNRQAQAFVHNDVRIACINAAEQGKKVALFMLPLPSEPHLSTHEFAKACILHLGWWCRDENLTLIVSSLAAKRYFDGESSDDYGFTAEVMRIRSGHDFVIQWR